MSKTYSVVVGDQNRIIIPIKVREQTHLIKNTTLIMLDTPQKIVLLTHNQLLTRIRTNLAGLDLISDLLTKQRTAAAIKNHA